MKKGLLEVLTAIYSTQAGDGSGFSGTAPVEVRIGYTTDNNQVQHNGIVVLKSNGAVLEAINSKVAELAKKDIRVSVSVAYGGLLITEY